jgi:DNA invertase Pin-like site-specific DNA recombinase
MKVALYARTTAADGRDTLDTLLAGLAAHAAQRGWTIALQCGDPGPWPEGKRDGLKRLTAAIRATPEPPIQAVLVRSLGHLARSLRHLTDLGRLLAARDIALIALDDHLDTTDPGGHLRWRDWLTLSARLTTHHRGEAARLAHLRNPGAPWGRPSITFNTQELLDFWEGREGRHPLTQRHLAAKLGLSEATLRKHLQTLRAAGHLDDTVRRRNLASRGGLRRGGRPATVVDDATLIAAWSQTPSLTAVARNLHVSRSRLRARLHHLGLLEPGSKPCRLN